MWEHFMTCLWPALLVLPICSHLYASHSEWDGVLAGAYRCLSVLISMA